MLVSFGATFIAVAVLLNAFAWWTMQSGHEAVEQLNEQSAHVLIDIAETGVVLGSGQELVATPGAATVDAARGRQLADVAGRMRELLADIGDDAHSPQISATVARALTSVGAVETLSARAAQGRRVPAAAYGTHFADVGLRLGELVDIQSARTEAMLADAEAAHDTGRLILIALGVLTLVVALAVIYAVSRRLSGRIEAVADVVDRLSEGDMTARTDDVADDEIGRIAVSFNVMVERLEASSRDERERMEALNRAMEEVSHFVDAVASGDLTAQLQLGDKGLGGFGLSTNLNRMVDGLASITSEVTRGTQEMGTSASQILAIVSGHNSATADQAASITQTSVTIDEVRANSEQVSTRASELADHARRASAISLEGRQAVERLVAGMDKIGRRMDVVTEEIRELTERSAAIGAINETVTDLADQSNMLALNATIEAARAGEQGRGFAVVADQVRNLAEQSKQATMQVQAILQEIQQASTRAVKAADSGARVVAEGRTTVDETGTVIAQLGDAVRQTADVAVQIASGAREQAVGMDQIGKAMEDVRESTVQLAAGASDTEAAAGSLNALADRLAAAAGRYRV